MSRVFLSFLGTSDYVPCTYYRGDYEAANVRFVQEAILKIECAQWTSDDRALIFTTGEAYRRNWPDNGHMDRETGRPLARTGLKRRIAGLDLPFMVERVDIPDGKSESEIWDIFNAVFENLREGEEVIFDITHAFRSIPMLAIVILNYAKVMKDVALGGIFYGAFEVLGSPFEVRKLLLEERRAPILELTAFDQLLDWSFAINQFLKAGNADQIRTLARSNLKQILAESRGKDKGAATIRSIGDRLEEYCRILSTCRGAEIGNAAMTLKEKMRGFDNFDMLPPFRPLFERMEAKLAPFGKNTFSDGIAAARWCIEHNLIQQGYTILVELLISHFVLAGGGDINDPDERNIVSGALAIAAENIPPEKWYKNSVENEERTRKYLETFGSEMELIEIMRVLVDFRNNINHAGFRKDARSSRSFPKQLVRLVERLESYEAHRDE